MNIVEVASECSGLAQRGGLGSVIWGISDAFRQMQHATTVILPYYAEIPHKVNLFTTLNVQYGGERTAVSVFETSHEQLQILLIHSDRFFRGEYADVYIDSSKIHRGFFEDDAKRFAYFSVAVCELLLHLYKKTKIDLIHCHDWHTGLVPLLIKIHPAFAALRSIPRLFTIHNLEYQGTRPYAAMGELKAFLDWFPELSTLAPDELKDYLDPHADILCINPMRAALNAADYVTTVSPSYAAEICLPDDPDRHFFGGRGLEKDLARLRAEGKLVGITNGIDTAFYDPAKLAHPYSHKNRQSGKIENRTHLFTELPAIIDALVEKQALIAGCETSLREKLATWDLNTFLNKPLLIAVTRLTGQKIQQFLEMLEEKSALERIAELPVHLAFLGKGDLLPRMQQLTHPLPNVLLFGGFDDDLEKRLYAAGDLMLMPSEFEPCGTSQMKAMRYGCLPLAAAVGGLKDTIRDGYNGFLYSGTSRSDKAANFLATIKKALDLLASDSKEFQKMQKHAMQTDFSWHEAARGYLSLIKP